MLVHLVARPVPGPGIAVPPLLPGLLAVVTAGVLHPAAIAGLAYVAGTLGTLAGADLANLRKMRRPGAPAASIGGAGTFAGVFLAGIIAVLTDINRVIHTLPGLFRRQPQTSLQQRGDLAGFGGGDPGQRVVGDPRLACAVAGHRVDGGGQHAWLVRRELGVVTDPPPRCRAAQGERETMRRGTFRHSRIATGLRSPCGSGSPPNMRAEAELNSHWEMAAGPAPSSGTAAGCAAR